MSGASAARPYPFSKAETEIPGTVIAGLFMTPLRCGAGVATAHYLLRRYHYYP